MRLLYDILPFPSSPILLLVFIHHCSLCCTERDIDDIDQTLTGLERSSTMTLVFSEMLPYF